MWRSPHYLYTFIYTQDQVYSLKKVIFLDVSKIAQYDVCLLRVDQSSNNYDTLGSTKPHLGVSVVSVSDSWPGGCEFDPRLRWLFFRAYFHFSPLQERVRKVVGGFGKYW